MATQASMWLAQMLDGTDYTGGSGDPADVNVSAVDPAQVQVFTVSSDSFADTVFIDTTNAVEDWYENGNPWTPVFPLVYALNDGTTLTIQRKSDVVGDLTYTQQ